jgi:threonine synthase
MPRPPQLGNPDSGATFAVDDIRALAFGDPAERAAGRAINLQVVYSSHPSTELFTADAFKDAFAKRRSLWDFRALLPIADEEPVTLGEGNTPLLPIPTTQGALYLKNESVNPTWSHKDRAMTVAVTVARSLGFHTVVGASTGNAGAALAAYAARAGMRCIMFTGTDVPLTMQTLMRAYGALLILAEGGPNRRALAAMGIERFGWFPGTNVTDPPVGSNAYSIEGYTTIAYEIARDLGDAPAAVVVPTSYADNLTGIWRGFHRLRSAGVTTRMPRMVVAEPARSAPYGPALASDGPRTIPAGQTAAFSIGGGTASWQGWHAVRDSGGTAVSVPEEEIIPTQLAFGAQTGLYLEAASIVGVHAARRVAAETDGPVVAIGTSSGLKDPGTTAHALPPAPTIPVDADALIAALRETYGLNPDALGTGK